MEKIARVNTPNMKIFLGESITGNDATEQARAFNETINITGMILSKADVDEKGGTAISVSSVTGKPILFLGTGQKYEDLEVFDKEKLIDSIIKDIQRALIEADVNIELVFALSQKIRKLAVDESIKGIDKKEQLIKLIHDEVERLLGYKQELKLSKKSSIMFMGLYGAGKTTTIAKLGFYYAKRGRKVALLGLDVDRPAAMDQLEQMAKKAKLPVFIDKVEKDPVKIIKKHEKELKKYDLVLIDTAGRDGLNKELIKQIEKLNKKLKPEHRLLVMPADVGQTAKTQAQEFQKALSVDGVIITRMDGTSKAGGALTACAETKAPVFFIGVGEQLHEIETFDPESFISRLARLYESEGDITMENVFQSAEREYYRRYDEGDARLPIGEVDLQTIKERVRMQLVGN